MTKYVLSAAVVLAFIFAVAIYVKERGANKSMLSIEEIVEQLRSADTETRYSAHELLEAREKSGLTREEGLVALQAATSSFPPLKYEWQDASGALVDAAASSPNVEYAAVIARHFSAYNSSAKTSALRLLTRLPDRIAAETYVGLVKAHARDGSLNGLPRGTFGDELRHAEVLFPALLEFTDVKALQWDIYLLCLNYLEKGALEPAALDHHADRFIETYHTYKVKLKPLQRLEGMAWMWEEAYQELRSTAALLLDIFGYVPGMAIDAELRDGISYPDPRLAFFAARSLLRKGGLVAEEDLLRIAASAETRNLLFDSLHKLGRSELFPKHYATQAALAESDMVNWLIYPTELGRVPDQIELMKVVSEDIGGDEGVLDFYLFRFRTDPPHWAAKDGWMSGVAGPFRRADAPSTTSYGETFSTFEKWDAKQPEEHVEEVKSVLQEWSKTNR